MGYTKIKYTQYYCSSDEGMKLKSGKRINCIENTELSHDFERIKYDIYPYEYSHYGKTCRSAFVMFEFFEKYYEILYDKPELKTLYYSISKYLTNIILPDLKSDYSKCFCDIERRQGDRECVLFREYEHLDVEREHHADYIGIGKELIDTYTGYQNRKNYRLYHRNFIKVEFMRVRRYSFPMPKHDITQIIAETEHWLSYFNRLNKSDRLELNKLLSKKTISDCASIITSFL